jgi:L-iditol 2-dehydrogenase
MKALVKMQTGKGHVELADWPEPFPGPGEVKLEIAAAGICGTDVHIVEGFWPCRPPVVLGHEFCGRVVEVGSGVANFRPGDRVVASNPARTCGLCRHCCGGNPFMCSKRISAGYMIDGAFAEYLCITAARCHMLPDNVSFLQAALGEPLSVAVHAAIERTTLHRGDLAVISGPGCVGLLTALVAKLEGARVIVAGTDKDRPRLELAKAMGVDAIVNVSQESLADVVHQHNDGEGADVVYECAGVPASLDACWAAVRNEGTIVPLGIYQGAFQTDFNRITMKELRVVGSFGYVWTSWNRCLQMLANNDIDTDKLISHIYPFERFEEALEALAGGRTVKVVMQPKISEDALSRVPVPSAILEHRQ